MEVKSKRNMSQGTIRQLKRKLGLHPCQPFYKCSGKSKGKARKLDGVLGKKIHAVKGHVCPECQCQQTAGCQTEHYGYGLCWMHERKIKQSKRMEEAEKHLHAIQARNPALYRHADAFEIEVKEKGKVAQIQTDFTKEIEMARDLVNEVIQKMQSREISKACTDVVPILNQCMDEICDATPERQDRLIEQLQEIKVMMTTPLTELAQGRHVPMSDKSFYELINKLIYNVGRMGVDQWTVNKHEVATREQLHIWYAKLVDVTRRYIQDPKDWADYVNDLRVVGDPKMQSV